MSVPHIQHQKELKALSPETLAFYTGEPLDDFMRVPCTVYKSINGEMFYSLVFNKLEK